MPRKILVYLVGLFVLTIGVGFSIKANLGVSPVSSIPYTMTLIAGIEMGKSTIMFHVVLILLQAILLRREFKIKHVAQLLVAVVFGYMTTFSNHLMTYLPAPEIFTMQMVYFTLSIIFVAFGIFLYLPPNLIPLAGEGVMQVISEKTKTPFSKVKVIFDTTMVFISTSCCLLILGGLGSIGIGTIASAILVGTVLSFIMKRFRSALDAFLNELSPIQPEEA